jgi:hypothetical protein
MICTESGFASVSGYWTMGSTALIWTWILLNVLCLKRLAATCRLRIDTIVGGPSGGHSAELEREHEQSFDPPRQFPSVNCIQRPLQSSSILQASVRFASNLSGLRKGSAIELSRYLRRLQRWLQPRRRQRRARLKKVQLWCWTTCESRIDHTLCALVSHKA